jgi:hypothetical protein
VSEPILPVNPDLTTAQTVDPLLIRISQKRMLLSRCARWVQGRLHADRQGKDLILAQCGILSLQRLDEPSIKAGMLTLSPFDR